MPQRETFEQGERTVESSFDVKGVLSERHSSPGKRNFVILWTTYAFLAEYNSSSRWVKSYSGMDDPFLSAESTFLSFGDSVLKAPHNASRSRVLEPSVRQMDG
jgi:hypothetical protein